MTPHDTHSRDDAEFDLFLKRQGKLAQRLQSLEQPEPPAELDAIILAKAERDLAASARLSRNASNDAAVAGAPPVRPVFFRRWQVPLGLAASVLVTALVALMWQRDAEVPLLVAQAPQAQAPFTESAAAPVAELGSEPRSEPRGEPGTEPAAPDPATSGADRPSSAEIFKRERKARNPTAPAAVPPVIARAEIPDEERRDVYSSAPEIAAAAPPLAIAQADIAQERHAPRAAASPPAASAPIPTGSPPQQRTAVEVPAKHPAKPWLALIEELLKADLRRDAQEEWKQFRKSYPDYEVPKKLKKELDGLTEK